MSKIGRVPLIISGICLALNFLIGDTIFANLIVLAMSFLSAVLALATSAFAYFRADKDQRSPWIMIGSLAAIVIVVMLFATDNVAAGYGP